jgi:hypothetical protein
LYFFKIAPVVEETFRAQIARIMIYAPQKIFPSVVFALNV